MDLGAWMLPWAAGEVGAPRLPARRVPAGAFETNALTQHAANCLKRPARGDTGRMRMVRTFVWNDGRPDDTDEIRSTGIDRHVRHRGVLFQLRTWDIRYPPGERRVTEAVYDEAVSPEARATGSE